MQRFLYSDLNERENKPQIIEPGACFSARHVTDLLALTNYRSDKIHKKALQSYQE